MLSAALLRSLPQSDPERREAIDSHLTAEIRQFEKSAKGTRGHAELNEVKVLQ
jgi:hypothetical protein